MGQVLANRVQQLLHGKHHITSLITIANYIYMHGYHATYHPHMHDIPHLVINSLNTPIALHFFTSRVFLFTAYIIVTA